MRWKFHIDGIAKLWKDGDETEFKEIGKKVAVELKKYACFGGFNSKGFEKVTSLEDFNRKVESLYNYCDTARIWLDPSD